MSNAITEFLGKLSGTIFGDKDDEKDSGSAVLQALLGLGTSSFLKDRGYLDKDIPVVGYQGKIPEYQAIQEIVKGRDDSNRRPGSGGRRYMSDVMYAKAPKNQQPMSVAEAQAKAKAQAQGFAAGGDVAAFLQGLGGEEGGGGYESLIQSMQPQGRAAPQRMQTAPAQPAPMPMPAPSGGMGGLDMLTLAALLQGQQGQQGGEAQPQAQPQQALPPGVAPGGKYYDFNGTPMYQPPMPTAAPGQYIAQVMPTPIDLTTGEPQRTSIGGGGRGIAASQKDMRNYLKEAQQEADLKKMLESLNNAKSAPVTNGGDLSEKIREAMKGKMPTPATDTIGTSGYRKGKGDRPQKSSSPISAGSPVKMPGERAPDRRAPMPIDQAKMLEGLGRFGSPVGGRGVDVPATGTPAKRGTKLGSGNAPRRATPPLPPVDKTDLLKQLKGRGTIADRPLPIPTPDFGDSFDIGGFFAKGGYLNGNSDGQADKVPGSIDGVQEARLSHGEYVLPADLVSLLGNGNSDAGAKALDEFMAMVRKKGTGTEKQQKNIKADKVLASLMKGKG